MSYSMNNTGTNLGEIYQHGGCRNFFSNLFMNKNKNSNMELPSGFPYAAGLGSADELNFFQDNSFRNWKRIPKYVRWMQANSDNYQADVEYRGHTQQVTSRMLDAILCMTSVNTSQPIGLSNFTNQAGKTGVLIDHNGQTLMSTTAPLPGQLPEPAKITFTGSAGTIFCMPSVEPIPQSTSNQVTFPIIILPLAADNDNRMGTQFLYITFSFKESIFMNNPGPAHASEANYTLRVSEYHDLVPLIQEIQDDVSISSSDKVSINQGILAMLATAISSTTVGSFEQTYQNTILSFLSSKLCVPQIPSIPTATDGLPSDFPAPGNDPIDISFTGISSADRIVFNITQLSGQTPVYTWTSRPVGTKGFGLQIVATNVYWGYDPSYTHTTQATSGTWSTRTVGWYTANSTSQDLAWVQRYSNGSHSWAKPTVFSSITDSIIFTVDETGPTAVLQVLDRQITLTPTNTSSPTVYPVFLKRSLQSAFASKQMVYTASKGVQGNLTLANLSVFSGMNLPMIQALTLTMVFKILVSSVPLWDGSSAATKGPFSFYSALFANADGTAAYKTSLRDLIAYFSNAQSTTMSVTMTASSLSISDSQAVTILNPTGQIVIAGSQVPPSQQIQTSSGTMPFPASMNGFPNTNAAQPDTSSTTSSLEKFSNGFNMTLGLSQGSDMRILLNSFSATAGAGGSTLQPANSQSSASLNGTYAVGSVSANATYQNGNYNGTQLTSTPYSVSRLRAGVSANGSNSRQPQRAIAAPASAASSSSSSSRQQQPASSSSSSSPPFVRLPAARINPQAAANNRAVVRNVVNRSIGK